MLSIAKQRGRGVRRSPLQVKPPSWEGGWGMGERRMLVQFAKLLALPPQNANWIAYPTDLTFKTGHTYRIEVSDPDTWSCNKTSPWLL